MMELTDMAHVYDIEWTHESRATAWGLIDNRASEFELPKFVLMAFRSPRAIFQDL